MFVLDFALWSLHAHYVFLHYLTTILHLLLPCLSPIIQAGHRVSVHALSDPCFLLALLPGVLTWYCKVVYTLQPTKVWTLQQAQHLESFVFKVEVGCFLSGFSIKLWVRWKVRRSRRQIMGDDSRWRRRGPSLSDEQVLGGLAVRTH